MAEVYCSAPWAGGFQPPTRVLTLEIPHLLFQQRPCLTEHRGKHHRRGGAWPALRPTAPGLASQLLEQGCHKGSCGAGKQQGGEGGDVTRLGNAKQKAQLASQLPITAATLDSRCWVLETVDDPGTWTSPTDTCNCTRLFESFLADSRKNSLFT